MSSIIDLQEEGYKRNSKRKLSLLNKIKKNLIEVC